MSRPRLSRLGLTVSAAVLIALTAALGQGVAAAGPHTSPQPFTNISQISSSIASFTSTLTSKGVVDLSQVPGFGSQVQNAGNDHPNPNCIAKLTATSVGGATCSAGDLTSTRVVVLFGDSHANQWVDVLAKIAKARQWKVVTVTKAGCPDADITYKVPPGPPFPPQYWGKTYVACTKWRKSAFKMIASLKPYLIIASGDTYLPTQVAGEKATLKVLDQAVKGHVRSHVIYIADTPRGSYGANATITSAQCLAASSLLVHYDPKDTTTSFADNPNVCYRSFYVQDSGPTIRSGIIAAAHAAAAKVIDPRPWLCDTVSKAGLCPPAIDGTLLYGDLTHLTDTYALRLQTLFGADLPST